MSFFFNVNCISPVQSGLGFEHEFADMALEFPDVGMNLLHMPHQLFMRVTLENGATDLALFYHSIMDHLDTNEN